MYIVIQEYHKTQHSTMGVTTFGIVAKSYAALCRIKPNDVYKCINVNCAYCVISVSFSLVASINTPETHSCSFENACWDSQMLTLLKIFPQLDS